MSSVGLQEPILDGGLQSVNFFNGRLLSGEDLTQERAANRAVSARLGQALGSGIVFGLEVAEAVGVSTNANPVVTVQPGLAVNIPGQPLQLPAATNVALTRADTSAPATPGAFSVCLPPQSGTLVAGAGVYLLVLSPASGPIGRAPASGLDCCDAVCNTAYLVDGVQFRLIQLPLQLEELQRGPQLRNYVAYRFFGPADTGYQQTFNDPFGDGPREYGLLAALRQQSCLTDGDVPLALICWTTDGGIEFIDRWAVRRRVTRLTVPDRWNALVGDRRPSEAEAMYLQFQEQVDELRLGDNPLAAAGATDLFAFLPPVGILPVSDVGSPAGFNVDAFFGLRASLDVALLDANLLRPLVRESFSHEPIDLMDLERILERIQLYLIRENLLAVQAGQSNQLVVVFARATLPYRGVARFGFAHWDLSRFAAAVI
jgi:hypothetical protein